MRGEEWTLDPRGDAPCHTGGGISRDELRLDFFKRTRLLLEIHGLDLELNLD
jgi:hypothetical protein